MRKRITFESVSADVNNNEHVRKSERIWHLEWGNGTQWMTREALISGRPSACRDVGAVVNHSYTQYSAHDGK
jgi:hypothetical protein